MLSRFFKKNALLAAPAQSFNQRINDFWKWFESNSVKFYDAIEDKTFNDLVPEFSEKMMAYFPNIAWVFGPGKDGIGHSLTLSGEGCPYKSMLVAHIIELAPQLNNWTFYNSRQASPSFADMKMNICDQEVMAEQIWVTPSIDIEREKIDLVCWNPLFSDLPEKDRGHITFLWLDEALGEAKVTHRLGYIDINDTKLESSIPLSELPDYVSATEKEYAWKHYDPLRDYVSFKVREPNEFSPEHPRSDIFSGTTLLYALITDYAQSEGPFEHPAPNWDVDFKFIAIPQSNFTSGKQVDERGECEDALEALFEESRLGKCLGGASGSQNMYIDLAFYEGSRSEEMVIEFLDKTPLCKGWSLHPFNQNSK